MSPLVGYDKYKEYHERIEQELIGRYFMNVSTFCS